MKRLLSIALLSTFLISCDKEEVEIDQPVEPENTDTTASNSLNLQPHFGSQTTYATNDPICPIVSFLGDFDTSGYAAGEIVHDFTLYNKDGDAFNLESKLLEGKPLMLMTGSYTCPAFRGALYELEQLISAYQNEVNFVIVYTVEAHPDIDISPYFDTVNTTQINVNQGILYQQPTTYGERVNIVADMLNAYAINCDVLIDSPCNEFWYTYGEAPNRAYLIDTTGEVVTSQGWFNFPYMTTAIDDYLGN